MVDTKNKQYQREHYLKNRDKISEAKKERYRTDPNYRKSAQKRALERYHATREGKQRGKRGYNHPKVAHVDGQDVIVHSVKAFADQANRNVQTIRSWEEKRVIPPPTFTDARNRRWYSDAHIARVVRAVSKFEATGALSLDVLKKLVEREFK